MHFGASKITLGHSVRYHSSFWTVVRVGDGRTLERTIEEWKSASFDHLDARGHRRGGWEIVGGDGDASPTTARDIDRRVHSRSIVDMRDARSDRRVVARTRVSRLEEWTTASRASWWLGLVLAIARGRREDDERWTRETRERAGERRGGARWGESRDARDGWIIAGCARARGDEPGADAAASTRVLVEDG